MFQKLNPRSSSDEPFRTFAGAIQLLVGPEYG
jgi:hypothetical protein